MGDQFTAGCQLLPLPGAVLHDVEQPSQLQLHVRDGVLHLTPEEDGSVCSVAHGRAELAIVGNTLLCTDTSGCVCVRERE